MISILLISLSLLPTIHASPPPTCKHLLSTPLTSPLQNQHTCPYPPEPFIVRPVPHKGLGVFARHDLPPGTTILREAPILTIQPPQFTKGTGYPMPAISHAVRAEFAHLPPEAQAEILTLHHHAFPHELEKQQQGDEGWSDVLGYIFRTNAYNTGTNIGLFPKIARINHSCRPNAAYTWNVARGERIVYASREIKEGEEIEDSYIPLLLTRDERRRRLARYGFECQCAVCAMEGARLKKSDKRRVRIAAGFKAFEQEEESSLMNSTAPLPRHQESSGKKGDRAAMARQARESLRLLERVEAEQLADYYAMAYKAVATSHARIHDWETATVWANKGFERRVMEDAGSARTAEMAELTRTFVGEWEKDLLGAR